VEGGIEMNHGRWTNLQEQVTACVVAASLLLACDATVDEQRDAGASPPGDSAAVIGEPAVMVERRAERCDELESELPALDSLSDAQLDSLLGALPGQLPIFEDRLRELILARLGQPYALGTLGEENDRDPDPVFRLDEADCTVLVLTTTALAHARTSADARAWMGPLNYHEQDGAYPVTYENRLHFTSDRITGSPLFEDLTARIVRPEERRSIKLTLNRKADGTHLLPIDWERAIVIDYIPAVNLEPVLDRLPSIAGIAFIREAWRTRGLLVAHEGFLIDRHCLVHASSVEERVVAVDLMDYLWRRSDPDSTRHTARFDGAILYAIRDGEGRVDPGRTLWPGGDGEE
jgi:hypothetical protein